MLGTGSRPERGSRVTIRYSEALSEEGDVVSEEQEVQFNVGESEVIQALDLAVPLMNLGEEAVVQVKKYIESVVSDYVCQNPWIPEEFLPSKKGSYTVHAVNEAFLRPCSIFSLYLILIFLFSMALSWPHI